MRWKQILKRWVLPALAVLVLIQVIALTPATLDEGDSGHTLDPQALLAAQSSEPTVIDNIPKKIPDYSVGNFTFSSVQGGVKQWRLESKKSYLFNQEKLVHARKVVAYLYDTEDKTTVITGSEARYYLNQQDLEIFGDVRTVFPDGFVLLSPYLRYRPRQRRIEIPRTYAVHGFGKATGGSNQTMDFHSKGFDYAMKESRIVLPEAVHFELTRPKAEGTREKEKTEIDSDRAIILRDKQVIEYTMSPWRLPSTRYVLMRQPTLYARSRRADVFYGDHSKDAQIFQYMTAYEDVLLKEKEAEEEGAKKSTAPEFEKRDPELRYSTSGRADFDSRRDVVILSEFPQVYQGQDTITGDVVILHKDSDVVEVENSNAYSRGQ